MTSSAAASVGSIPVYEALAADIKGMGVEAVFGLMSDDTALFCTALDSRGVRFYGARHENNAVAMAEGYAASTGRLRIAIVGRGPATANAMNGANYVQRTGSRVLLIVGATAVTNRPVEGYGPDTKMVNAVAMLEAVGLRVFVASAADNARRTLANAVAATDPGGCAALLLPMNVQFASIAYEAGSAAASGPAGTADSIARKSARAPAIEASAAILNRSRKPLFVVGLGAHRSGAREAIERLADKVGAAVATSLKAKDMFRGYAYNCGVVGSFSHAAGRRLIDDADCIVVFGAGLNQRTTSYGTSMPDNVPLIHIDTARQNIGRWFHADIAMVADARTAAMQLAEAVAAKPPADKPFHTEDNRKRLADYDMASEFQSAHTPRTMDPRALTLELDRLLPPNRNAVYDAGNFLQVLPFFSLMGPDHLKNTHDSSSIGLGFGTALGYARGTPDRTTVLFLGDGSFLMTMGELETVVREDLPLVIVLMNDCAYGAELHYLKIRNAPVAKSVFPDIDYAPIAEAFGFQAATIRTLDELRALEPMLRNPEGPILLDCKITAALPAPFLLESVEYERRKR